MANGRFQKGRRRTAGSSRRSSYTASGRRSTAKRSTRGRGTRTGRVAAVKPQTIRLVFAMEPGGASLANPALPIPPSVVMEKTRKAKL